MEIPFIVTYTDVLLYNDYQAAVYWATDNGIAGGFSNGSFGINSTITRGQAITFIWKEAGWPDPIGSTQTFTDVPVNHNYYKAIQWAYENGITAGYADGSFGVGNGCTKGQVATFLWRYFGRPEPVSSLQTFSDIPTNHNYYKAIQWLYESGVSGATSGTAFGSGNGCARGQFIQYLYGLCAGN